MVGIGIQLELLTGTRQPCKVLSWRKSLLKGVHSVCGMLGYFLGLLRFLLFSLNLDMICFHSRGSSEGIQHRVGSILL